mmetsp:Transcript_71452/g.185526  ORF Transcript_71452/g.185526 Transcript_71452/m.185526 type:complete len:211 (-) Transcript_71452:719-1351(-)
MQAYRIKCIPCPHASLLDPIGPRLRRRASSERAAETHRAILSTAGSTVWPRARAWRPFPSRPLIFVAALVFEGDRGLLTSQNRVRVSWISWCTSTSICTGPRALISDVEDAAAEVKCARRWNWRVFNSECWVRIRVIESRDRCARPGSALTFATVAVLRADVSHDVTGVAHGVDLGMSLEEGTLAEEQPEANSQGSSQNPCQDVENDSAD